MKPIGWKKKIYDKLNSDKLTVTSQGGGQSLRIRVFVGTVTEKKKIVDKPRMD